MKVGGIDYAANVMNNLDHTSEKNIFDGLTAYDQEPADEIRKWTFVFEDVITMDDRSVQRFVQDCGPRDLVLALKAVNRKFPGSCSAICPSVWPRTSGTV